MKVKRCAAGLCLEVWRTHTDGRVQAVRNELLNAAVGREGRPAITRGLATEGDQLEE